MPHLVKHTIKAGEARKGDMYDEQTIARIKHGTSRITFYDADDKQFAYLLQLDEITVRRSEPTARENLSAELDRAAHYLAEYDASVTRARAFNAVTAFTEAVTDRNGHQWALASSFQVGDFIERQAYATFWARLPLTEELREETPAHDGSGAPLQSTRAELERMVQILRNLRERYLDHSPSRSTSSVSNIMDEALHEVHRKAVGDYFNSGLRRFEYIINRVEELEAEVRTELEPLAALAR